MANKRDFKKSVEAVGAALCDEMMVAYYNVEGVDRGAIETAIAKVLGAVASARANANMHFDRGAKAFENPGAYTTAKREYFTALFERITKDYNAAVDEALKLFNGAIPASVKEDNKNSVN